MSLAALLHRLNSAAKVDQVVYGADSTAGTDHARHVGLGDGGIYTERKLGNKDK